VLTPCTNIIYTDVKNSPKQKVTRCVWFVSHRQSLLFEPAADEGCRKQIINLVNHATVNYGMKLVQSEAVKQQRQAKRSSVQSLPDL